MHNITQLQELVHYRKWQRRKKNVLRSWLQNRLIIHLVILIL